MLGRLVLQYAVVGKTIDVFSTQAVCMTPARIMKAIQQGESFLVNLRLISLSLEANVCGIFSESVLPCSYCDSPRAVAIPCAVLETHEAMLTTNS